MVYKCRRQVRRSVQLTLAMQTTSTALLVVLKWNPTFVST